MSSASSFRLLLIRLVRTSAMGILEKISEIEKEIARTQKNKGKPTYRVIAVPGEHT